MPKEVISPTLPKRDFKFQLKNIGGSFKSNPRQTENETPIIRDNTLNLESITKGKNN